jgi:hypothetical protein
MRLVSALVAEKRGKHRHEAILAPERALIAKSAMNGAQTGEARLRLRANESEISIAWRG